MQIKFKVALGLAEKKAGEAKEVTLEVSFDGVEDAIIQKAAMAHAVVAWQSQIRSHWDEFMNGELPEEVTFGVPLFAPKRAAAKPITMEEMTKHVTSLSPEKQAEFIKSLMDVAGNG